jgi:hypothetical protein
LNLKFAKLEIFSNLNLLIFEICSNLKFVQKQEERNRKIKKNKKGQKLGSKNGALALKRNQSRWYQVLELAHLCRARKRGLIRPANRRDMGTTRKRPTVTKGKITSRVARPTDMCQK